MRAKSKFVVTPAGAGAAAGNVSVKKIREARSGTMGQRLKREWHRNGILYLMAVPILAYFICFCYLPMFGIVIAFKNFQISKGVFDSAWVGLKYFREFFESMYFGRILRNTLLISLYDILICFPAPILFALLLNELRQARFKKVVQTVTYLPHFISLVVICGIITDFFSSNGLITSIIAALGGERTNYIGSAGAFRSIYIGSNLWQTIGWSSIIYLAAITSIDQELYEAAEIDGAGKLRQVVHITLPGISSTIVILLIMRLGQILSVGYEKIILLYGPGTYETADIISSFVYRKGLGESSQYSYASAVGLFQSVVNLIMLVSANFVSKKISETSLF